MSKYLHDIKFYIGNQGCTGRGDIMISNIYEIKTASLMSYNNDSAGMGYEIYLRGPIYLANGVEPRALLMDDEMFESFKVKYMECAAKMVGIK